MDLKAELPQTLLLDPDGSPAPQELDSGSSKSLDELSEDTAGSSYSSQSTQMLDVAFIFQSLCYLHRYTRGKDDSHIVERAERIRSVFLGISVAHARLASQQQQSTAVHVQRNDSAKPAPSQNQAPSLEDLLGNLKLHSAPQLPQGRPFSILSSQRRIPLSSSFVSQVHGEKYLQSLGSYIAETPAKHAQKESEVPNSLSQGDLYLCQDSLQSVEGALGACCDAVDDVCSSRSPQSRRFVCIRPPGHHCESEQPMGFCWVNNAAVAAAYAHHVYKMNRILIFDIDLHHGNGTQEIVWRLNAAAHKIEQSMNKQASPKKGSPKKALVPPEVPENPLKLFYGSLHDVNSYPCEDLDPILTANASVNIAGGGGGQHIANVHLEPYQDEDDFHTRLYPAYREALFGSARRFLNATHASPQNTLILLSAGFDASEHEYASMSRHGAKVPTSFFSRFVKDVTAFAKMQGSGKIVAVLEGGYSPRALSSGAGSFMETLACDSDEEQEGHDTWWNIGNISDYERSLSSQSVKTKKVTAATFRGAHDMALWNTAASDLFSKLVGTLPVVTAEMVRGSTKSTTPPSTSMRTTRSQASSPAVKARQEPETRDVQSHRAPPSSLGNNTSFPTSVTPEASPFVDRGMPSVSTPVVRFTFKAGAHAAPERQPPPPSPSDLPPPPSSSSPRVTLQPSELYRSVRDDSDSSGEQGGSRIRP